MKVRLIKLESTHENLRTDVVEGTLEVPPQIGEHMLILADPIDQDADVRYIMTSEITGVLYQPGIWHVSTKNSTYQVEEIV